MKTTHYYHFIIGCLLFLLSLLTIEHREDRSYTIGYMAYASSPAVSVPDTRLAGTSGILPVASPMVTERVSLTKEPTLDKGEESATTGAHTLTAAFTYALGDAYIAGVEGSLRHETALTITGIEDASLPGLNPGMVNVTGGQTGYRMLPHGMKFSKDITVVLPYDTSLLPPGFRADEIMTYYYDEQYRSWIAIERDSVDTENRVVVSRVDHFTDFINAVIRTPEMPETQAYVPTEMSGLQAMDPLSSFTLMSPPVANNQGTANLHYPLALPAGRQGMEPNLALTYNSGGGNGWMGMGWDISIPAITIETRWGVPQYSASKESEVYVLNGEQLATKNSQGDYNPLGHRAEWVNRMNGDVQFYPRTEGAFQRIIRHGNSPKNYWWEVRDKDGKIYYYGKKLGTNEFDPNAVLRDPTGNIAKWGLTEIRDLHDNFVRYMYEVGGDHQTRYMYIKNIYYTGHGTTLGKYRIEFCRKSRSSLNLKDITSNGRYGFLEVINDLLNTIKIYYNNELFKGYSFVYEKGAFGKTLLMKVEEPGVETMLGNDDNRILTHLFTYHQPPAKMFGDVVSIESPIDVVQSGISMFGQNDIASAIGGTTATTNNVGGALTVGFGANAASKNLSGGGNYDHNGNKSVGVLTMIDIDGDGLPDRVYRTNNGLYYRKLIFQNGKYSFSEAVPLRGSADFLRESSSSNDWGLEGHAGVGLAGVTATYTRGTTKSTTSVYFTDVDGDGYPDIANNGIVYYNRDAGNGRRKFTPMTTDTIWVGGSCGTEERFILQDEGINERIFTPGETLTTYSYTKTGLDSSYVTVPAFEHYFPDYQTVRVWVAPYTGAIRISGVVVLSPDLHDARIRTKVLDGVKLSIQQNNRLLHSGNLIPGEEMSVYKTNIAVTAGDRIYFRVESQEKRLYDKVNWDPNIQYTKIGSTNINYGAEYDSEAKNKIGFIASQDFVVSADQKLEMPFAGKVNIEVECAITEALRSDVKVTVYYRDQPVLEHTFAKRQIHFSRTLTLTGLTVNANNGSNNEVIYVRVETDGNVKWESVKCVPKIYYTKITDQDLPEYDDYTNPGTPIPNYVYYPAPYYRIYYVKSSTTGIKLSDRRVYNFKPKISFNKSFGGNFKVVIKSEMGTEMVQDYAVVNGVVRPIGTVPSFMVYPGRTYHVNYCITNQSLLNALSTIPASCYFDDIEYAGAGLLTEVPESLKKFGPMYRNWGQFVYKAPNPGDILIDENLLNMDGAANAGNIQTGSLSGNLETMEQEMLGQGIFDPANTNFLPMQPDILHARWIGHGNINYITKNQMSNYFPQEITGPEIIDITESPVPVMEPGQIAKAGVKTTVNKNNAGNLSANATVAGASGSKTWGYNAVWGDFMDMNGDRYPDNVSVAGIHYTKPQGGFSRDRINGFSLSMGKGIDSTRSEGTGTSFFGSLMDLNKESKNSPKSGISHLSGNNGTANSSNNTHFTFMDMNGDGLPDKVWNDGYVSYNVGFVFNDPVKLSNVLIIRRSSGVSDNSGFNLGANLWQTSFSGGLGGSTSNDHSSMMLIDINGDGLPDKVDGNRVYYNNGKGFEDNSQSLNISKYSGSSSKNWSGNLAVSAGVPIWLVKIVGNVKGSKSFAQSKTGLQLMDIDGDGYPDYVESNSINDLRVRFNQTGKTNLLKSVINLAKGEITMDYKLSENSVDCPQRSWTLSEVQVYDGVPGDGVDIQLTKYEYSEPYYDRFDRENLGFAQVKTIECEANGTEYRIKTEKYHNRDYMRKGLKYYELLADKDGKKFIEKDYVYVLKEISSGVVIPAATAFCYGEGYPALNQETVKYYEGQSIVQITTRKRYEHGPYGNVTKYYNDGETHTGLDDFWGEIVYYQGDLSKNLVGIPVSIKVRSGSTVLRERRSDIDSRTGKCTRITQITNTQGATAVYDFTYDGYGNITKMTMPANHRGQRMAYTYTYDTYVRTYPVKVTNAMGLFSSSTYDYRRGKPLTTTDVNGNTIEYTYDFRGRLAKIKGPDEDDYTIKYGYGMGRNVAFSNLSIRVEKPRYAVTEHFDPLHPDNPMTTVLISDGLGRNIQTKKDIFIDNEEKRVVSGKNEYDARGRVIKSWQPVTEPLSVAWNVYNTNVDPNPPTVVQYDLLDRQLSVTLPNSAVTRMAYGTGTDAFNVKRFMNRTTDANGNVVTEYKDTRGLITSMHAPLDAVTTFAYNALGELTRTVNPDGAVSSYTYDLLGRCTAKQYPDAGTEIFTYDAAGNLASRQTQSLLEKNKKINYQYYYNLLTDIIYPLHPVNNVHYEYGLPNSPYLTTNSLGKVVIKEDATGFSRYNYNSLGAVISEKLTFVLPNEGYPYTFHMNYAYDSWNRMLSMSYPDGEEVNYAYDVGGNLRSVTGTNGRQAHRYVDNITYDKFGNRTRIEYGNRVFTNYSYDLLQRLSTMDTYDPTADAYLQQLTYTYDGVGNITRLVNASGQVYEMGGKYDNEYRYDGLHRLIHCNNEWGESPQINSWLWVGYSSGGRIAQKDHSYMRSSFDNETPIVQYRDYYYRDLNSPNRLTGLYDYNTGEDYTFTWDANGNMIGYNRNGLQTVHYWDEDHRMLASGNSLHNGFYFYNGEGERTYKLSGMTRAMNINGQPQTYEILDRATLYVSPYLVASERGASKHIYAGTERIASHPVNSAINGLNSDELSDEELMAKLNAQIDMMLEVYLNYLPGENQSLNMTWDMLAHLRSTSSNVPKDEIYYYHTDHLGSSSWITYTDGLPVQYMSYMPFGESQVDQRAGDWNSRYTFSGKERDEETGYSYFGARYYDPDISIWLSRDPLADNNPQHSPYVYCANNPLRLVDPDGKDWYEFDNKETGNKEIKWTDYKSQDEMKKNGVEGNYLGEAFVHFQGSTDEKVGANGKLDGEGAKAAQVTIYGINGSDDIKTYDGLSMSSDHSQYSAVESGDYKAFYQDMSTSAYGSKGGSLSYRISNLDGTLSLPIEGGEKNKKTGANTMSGIFFHRTNNNGYAGNPVSKGCPVIDGRQWKNVEKQLGKTSNIYFRISR